MPKVIHTIMEKPIEYAILLAVTCSIFVGGWVIFLIILIAIGCLAAAGAAFWFFYWKRKTGGRDGEEKKKSNRERIQPKVDMMFLWILIELIYNN
ncbi:hypothetical protein L3Y34_019196 [Caenorhabditis briggsae]|uniref:Uncharacterized protein n=1 Tax=Caenorhabditis briggsae TaxID=6238 RepID=A0AAE9IVT3_CAEBR|nr:hypothetical protein L3Y34_019196 [Caenorhabditis briggsae]